MQMENHQVLSTKSSIFGGSFYLKFQVFFGVYIFYITY